MQINTTVPSSSQAASGAGPTNTGNNGSQSLSLPIGTGPVPHGFQPTGVPHLPRQEAASGTARQVHFQSPSTASPVHFAGPGKTFSMPAILRLDGNTTLASNPGQLTRLVHAVWRATHATACHERAGSAPNQRIFSFQLLDESAFKQAATVELTIDHRSRRLLHVKVSYPDGSVASAAADRTGTRQQQAALGLGDLDWLQAQCVQNGLPDDAAHQIVHHMARLGDAATHASTQAPYFTFNIGVLGERSAQIWNVQLDFRDRNSGMRLDSLWTRVHGASSWTVTPRDGGSAGPGTASVGSRRSYSQMNTGSDTSIDRPPRHKQRIEVDDIPLHQDDYKALLKPEDRDGDAGHLAAAAKALGVPVPPATANKYGANELGMAKMLNEHFHLEVTSIPYHWFEEDIAKDVVEQLGKNPDCNAAVIECRTSNNKVHFIALDRPYDGSRTAWCLTDTSTGEQTRLDGNAALGAHLARLQHTAGGDTMASLEVHLFNSRQEAFRNTLPTFRREARQDMPGLALQDSIRDILDAWGAPSMTAELKQHVETLRPQSGVEISPAYARMLESALLQGDFAIVPPEAAPEKARDAFFESIGGIVAYLRFDGAEGPEFEPLDGDRKSSAERIGEIARDALPALRNTANFLAAVAEQPVPTPQAGASGRDYFFTGAERYRTAMARHSPHAAREDVRDAYYTSNLLGEYIAPESAAKTPLHGTTIERVEAMANALGLQTKKTTVHDAGQATFLLHQLQGKRLMVTYPLKAGAKAGAKADEMRLVFRADLSGQWWVAESMGKRKGWCEVDGGFADTLSKKLFTDPDRAGPVKMLAVPGELDTAGAAARAMAQYRAASTVQAPVPHIESGCEPPKVKNPNNVTAWKSLQSRLVAADIESVYRDNILTEAGQVLEELEKQGSPADVTVLWQDATAFEQKVQTIANTESDVKRMNRRMQGGRLLHPSAQLPERPLDGPHQGELRAWDRHLIKGTLTVTTRCKTNAYARECAKAFHRQHPQVTSLKQYVTAMDDTALDRLATALAGPAPGPGSAPGAQYTYQYKTKTMFDFLKSARDNPTVDAPPTRIVPRPAVPAAQAVPAPGASSSIQAAPPAAPPLRTNKKLLEDFLKVVKRQGFSKSTLDETASNYYQFCGSEDGTEMETWHRAEQLRTKIASHVFMKTPRKGGGPMAPSSQMNLRLHMNRIADYLDGHFD
jgi:hypothetical protein